ncbi:hypothetical protein COU15_01180 [Candidatus Kaiserbacteria bacterium CG10_big_fil_rev_8_21_14_0_10_45_20]|uniref:Thioredoxin domain-containing protein n=1 Tax=Candidatus Kaiserbacteria bacterium CG10_big_fil_rev_8_21_14_0_10_45_20 TaxID=1974607 RepID=A0A2H0UG45_9BACT|nr:MAG: hypothetical protein COU15_01180 [Candidatus Kaiserbacteria bacterium CG10_big_fil_rev_8_21_14_0_10_45_20]
MNTKAVSIILIAVILIGGGFWYVSSQNGEENDTLSMENSSENETMLAGEQGVENDSMVGGDAMVEGEGEMVVSGSGSYEAYSEEKLALAENEDVLLFFHADWCPTCRAIEAEFKALETIPQNVHILKVDFDTETTLRQKYGVTTQHTFVQVNAEGDLIQKFSNANTAVDVFAQVK